MQLPEWSESLLLSDTPFGKGRRYVYVYSPLCGTCRVGMRMLEVACAASPEQAIGICNINLTRELAGRWKVESVPCLVHLEGGEVRRKLYRLGSVEDLLGWIRSGAPSHR
ncbi:MULTISPECIES: thioredoxin family protein [Paenibacillus]|uniref:thioredoxin family protein n=1 Tax=Paenibacillus TaxID=44249 RepID=UPI0022B8B2DA|nr:thioredoxin family protein [Paenibacillus caseinilyticus]MCZ8521525.1 thioredoxin family protein [Paenibacillus caseinilyticus]